MKASMVLAIIGVLVLSLSGAVKASGTQTVNGRWAGTAFANPAFDLNGDGIAGRMFTLQTYADPFSTLEGVFDTGLVGIGCNGVPGALDLKPFGTFTLRTKVGDSLFFEVDPNGPDLCFDPAHPSEVLTVRITGGNPGGPYEHATGSGTLTLHDIVRLTTPVTLPGIGTVPAPTLIDTRGEFSLTIQ
jgi:hypothetical protein